MKHSRKGVGIAELAGTLGLSQWTTRAWVRKGQLRAWRLGAKHSRLRTNAHEVLVASKRYRHIARALMRAVAKGQK